MGDEFIGLEGEHWWGRFKVMVFDGKISPVLVTGGSGFLGGSLVRQLRRAGADVVGTARGVRDGDALLCAPPLGPHADWRRVLRGREVVVHAAARVHVMSDRSPDPLAAFRSANVDGTLALARQAAFAGVRRFVFVSSIKVNGEHTVLGRPFTVDDSPSPVDAYGISKAEAEAGLKAIAIDTGMQVVVIRPPLVYGPGVKANFLSMMRWLRRGVPLPFGAVEHNRRSLVALDNLVDLIVTCIDHPAAANRTFLVSDGEDLSAAELLRRLAAAMRVRARLVRVPVQILETGAAVLGKRAMMQRLCGNLQVDVAHTREVLGWRPPIDVDEGLRRAAAGLAR